ncbi:MAG: pirin family protein [Chitinophagales bacterium]
MTTRTFVSIETATDERVGAFKIKNVLPTRQLKQIDPFLLIHHLQPTVIKPGADLRIPPHPHAGFEVVTYLLDGEFFHRDSKGNDQVARGGDINWMSSGSGITHSEGPTEAFANKGEGIVQLLQVWINLPSEEKKSAASFRHYAADSFPVIEDEKGWMKILLGVFDGKISPISTHTPMFFYHIKTKKGHRGILPIVPEYSAGAYIMHGQIKTLDKDAKAGDLIHFNTDGDQIAFTATEDSEWIVFGGLPIKEKVVSYGPFVMNSFEEIQKAISDYETGKMGQLSY